jgi:hypothetical protein
MRLHILALRERSIALEGRPKLFYARRLEPTLFLKLASNQLPLQDAHAIAKPSPPA